MITPKGVPSTEPWLLNKDWASGDIPDQIGGNFWIAWASAVIWACAIVPMSMDVTSEIRRHDYSHVWFVLIFLVIGIGLSIWAVQSACRVIKFGKSTFHIQTLPAVPGGCLAGTIRVTRLVNCDSGMHLNLVCVHLTRTNSGNGNRNSYFEENIWQAAQTLDRLPIKTGGAEIPVFFNIPADVQACDDSDRESKFVWRLEARATCGISNYYARFDVPVFVNADASALPIPRDGGSQYRHKDIVVLPQRMSVPGITCRPMAGGGLEIYFARARNKSAAIMSTFFGLLMIGIVVLAASIGSDTFLIFRIIWYVGAGALPGLIAFICIYTAICAWFVTSDIIVSHGAVHLSKGIWLFRRRVTLKSGDITSVTHISSGNSGGVPFYAIELNRPGNIPMRVADFIKQKDYAGWLASEISRRMGVGTEEVPEMPTAATPVIDAKLS